MDALRLGFTLALFLALIAAPSSMPAEPATSELAKVLAPSGKLRVGVYLGSPTSMVRNDTGETRGVAFELGQELAKRLTVPFEPVTFPTLAGIIDAMSKGLVDFTVTNATTARAQVVDFSNTLLSLELGFLVLGSSRFRASDEIDQPSIKIGVVKGSSSARTLPAILKQAAVTPVPNLAAAAHMIANKEIDAFATNKAILFEMADKLPDARILEARWGLEQLAIAVPKGRAQAQRYMGEFVVDVQENGRLAQFVARADLRGMPKPDR